MRIERRELLQGLLPALCSPGLLAQTDAPATTPLAELLRARLEHEGRGLAAARIGSSGTELAALGVGAPAGQTLDPRRHAFEIGSITKTFVGLLLADAVLRGELELEQSVESLLPAGLRLRDDRDRPLRLVDLATQRSGLPRLPPNLPVDGVSDPYAGYGDAALLAAVAAYSPSRGRDARFEYSNFGFGLLGWLLARRAGSSLDALLQRRVFAPLGLRMQLSRAGSARALWVQGHGGDGRPVPAWHFGALAGAGALRGSAADLARYAEAALGLRRTPLQAAFALALKPHGELGPQPRVQMGLGWMLAPELGLATHDGGTFGFSSSLWLDLRERRAGLVLANQALPVGDLARHLAQPTAPLRDLAAEKARQRALAEQPSVSLNAEQLQALSGSYALNPQFKLTLSSRDGRLFAQASGQMEFELFAKSARRFFARITPLEIEFDGAQGRPALLTLFQGGQQLRFRRE